MGLKHDLFEGNINYKHLQTSFAGKILTPKKNDVNWYKGTK
jgi:hypothetical protein